MAWIRRAAKPTCKWRSIVALKEVYGSSENKIGSPYWLKNPWAERPLPAALKTIRRYEADNDQWVLREGVKFADILGLPDPWPPEDTADE